MKIRADIHSFQTLQLHTDVKPDLIVCEHLCTAHFMKLLGKVEVASEESLREREEVTSEEGLPWKEETPQDTALSSFYRHGLSSKKPAPLSAVSTSLYSSMEPPLLPESERNGRLNVKRTQDVWTESLRRRALMPEMEELGSKVVSLSEEAEKRRMMLQVNGVRLVSVPFAETKILKSSEQGRLYVE